MADDDADHVGVRFSVVLDNGSVGVFTTCEGLGLEVVLEQREEGGNNSMVWQLPTRIKYGNIKLTRPVGPDTKKLTDWITNVLNGVKPATAVITAIDVQGGTVAE